MLGSDKRLEAWRRVDKKVNKYPGQRVFKAVGESQLQQSLKAQQQQFLEN